jgi:hypothetical protein
MGEIIITGNVFKLAVYYSPVLIYNGLPSAPIDFYKQASHIRGQQTNFTVSQKRLSNSLLSILTNMSELKQWITSVSTKRMGNLQPLKKPTAKGNNIQVLPPRKLAAN